MRICSDFRFASQLAGLRLSEEKSALSHADCEIERVISARLPALVRPPCCRRGVIVARLSALIRSPPLLSHRRQSDCGTLIGVDPHGPVANPEKFFKWPMPTEKNSHAA